MNDVQRAAALRAAMAGAGVMIAFQVAARATRDALFLSSHPVTDLPAMLIATAVVSVPVIFGMAALMSRHGPRRVIPAGYAASAAIVLAIWVATVRFEKASAIALFLHVGAVGPVLISGFWSIVTERFDPRTAKRHIGRIGALGTLGGLAGGLAANRLAAAGASDVMLPVLALLHVSCAFATYGVGGPDTAAGTSRPGGATSTRAPDEAREPGEDDAAEAAESHGTAIARAGELGTGLRILRRVPYLRSLAALVLLSTAGEALLDYVFKAQASAAFQGRDELMRIFSLFHTGTALLAFVLQTWLSRRMLQRAGIARTVGLLPAAMAATGLGVLFAPGFLSATIARGTDAVLRNSLFRSGYELLFNPVSPAEKRGTKALVDVGFARLGDAAGGVLTVVLLGLGAGALPIAAVVLALGGLFVVYALHRGYVAELESSLVRGVGAGSNAGPPSMDETHTIDLATLRARIAAAEAATAGTTTTAGMPEATPSELEPLVARIADLHATDPMRVRRGLHGALVGPETLPHVVPLLGRDELSAEVIAVLQAAMPMASGQLTDALLDPETPLGVRRRIPRILAAVPSVRAVQNLFAGLEDRRFDVRVQCGRALARLHARAPHIAIEDARVFALVRREVEVERRIWEGQRQMERLDDAGDGRFFESYLRQRADSSLEHVFTLLSLVLPAQPLRIAYQGLYTTDPMLRGMALEYLESVLPAEIRTRLWPFLEEPERPARPARDREQIMNDLLRSNESIRINLSEMRRQQEGEQA